MRVAGLINSEEGIRIVMRAAKLFMVGQRARVLGRKSKNAKKNANKKKSK